MIRGQICHASDDTCLIPNASKTTHALDRMRGLLFRPQISSNEALLITHCSSVHTVGMSYNIDIAYLDKQLAIVKLVKSLRPLRMSACRGAAMTLEMAEYTIERLHLEPGMQLRWQDLK